MWPCSGNVVVRGATAHGLRGSESSTGEGSGTLGELSTHPSHGMMTPSFALNEPNLCWAKDAKQPDIPSVYIAIANCTFPRLTREPSQEPGGMDQDGDRKMRGRGDPASCLPIGVRFCRQSLGSLPCHVLVLDQVLSTAIPRSKHTSSF